MATDEPASTADRGPADEPFASSDARASREYGGARPQPFRALRAPRSWKRFVPLVGDLGSYDRSWLRTDVVAGVAIAALAVPQAMAYAQTAGMPVAAGLYGLLLPVVAYATFGSSRLLMTGPTATAALLVGPAVAPLADGTESYALLAAMLALLVGVVFALARIARLGWIADYFSVAVLLGFLTGLALTLISGQLGVVAGVAVPDGTPLQEFVHFLQVVFGGADLPTLAVGAASLLALLLGGHWFPTFPTLLLVTVVSIAASWALDLSALGVALVGEIPAGLPELTWPGVGVLQVIELVPAAVAIALVGYSDAVLTGRSVARDGRAVDADQELVALAGMNLAAGVTGSFPLGSSGSRTAVNVRLGGRSQVVGLVQVVGVAAVLLFLTAPLALLPKATLGAVIIYAAIGLIDLAGWRRLARSSRGELVIAGVTVLGMLTVGLLPALLIAVLLSIIDVVRRSAQPRDAVLGWSPTADRFVDVQHHGDARVVPGVVVYRLDDRLFFANTQYFRSRVREAVDGAPYEVHTVVFDAEGVTHFDASGAQGLRSTIDELADRGILFVIARLKSTVGEQLSRLGLADALPAERRYPTIHGAVRAVAGVDFRGAQ